jgi:flagellar biosynthesis protein FliQ
MSGELALQLMGDTLFAGLLIGAPVLGLSMLVGLVVSVVQVVTQIQEMSLTFVPKLLAVAATLIAFGPWMLSKLLAFAVHLYSNIPAYV